MAKYRGRCQWEGCTHPDFESERPAKYCSDAHKQAAYRKRNSHNVTPVTPAAPLSPPPAALPSDGAVIDLLSRAVELLTEMAAKLDRPVQFAGIMAPVAAPPPSAQPILPPTLDLKVEQATQGRGDEFDNFLNSLLNLEVYDG